MEFLSQRREGAKIVNSLTLRLCVRLFPRLSAHAVSHNSQIGGVRRGVSRFAVQNSGINDALALDEPSLHLASFAT